MSALINPAIIDEIKSVYPLMKLKSLSPQQEKCLYFYLKGHSLASAARAAGYGSPAPARQLIESETGKAILSYFHDQMLGEISITRDTITVMLLEAHAKASNCAEEVMALRELAKLHDLYKDSQENRKKATIQINQQTNITNHKQLERMPTRQLLDMVGDEFKHLFPDMDDGRTYDNPPREKLLERINDD